MLESSTKERQTCDLFQELNPKKTLKWGQEDFGHLTDLDHLFADLDHLASFFKCILNV